MSANEPINAVETGIFSDFRVATGMSKASVREMLTNLLAGYDGMDESLYTEDSWEAFEKETDASEAILEKEGATIREIYEQSLRTQLAWTNLVLRGDEPVPPVDKTHLQEAIGQAEGLDESVYTPNSWVPLVSALQVGKSVNDDPDATQEDVDSATNNIVTAIANLVPRANKTSLQAALTQASSLSEGDYTPASWAPLINAVQNGNAVNNDLNANQTDVDSATVNINTAISNLVPKADKTSLQDALTQVSTLNEGDYTPESWAALSSAVQAGNTVNNDPNATQVQVDNATMAIRNGINNLQPAVVPVDKSALSNALQNAGTYDEADYTPESWAPFSVAVQNGASVMGDPDATQEDVDAATQAINTAEANLVKVEGGGGEGDD